MPSAAQTRVAVGGTALDGAAREQCRVWYEQHGEAVYNNVRFQVAEPDAAEDIVADTFLRAIRSASRYDATRGRRVHLAHRNRPQPDSGLSPPRPGAPVRTAGHDG